MKGNELNLFVFLTGSLFSVSLCLLWQMQSSTLLKARFCFVALGQHFGATYKFVNIWIF